MFENRRPTVFAVQGEGQTVPVGVQRDVALLHSLLQGGQRPEDRLHTLGRGERRRGVTEEDWMSGTQHSTSLTHSLTHKYLNGHLTAEAMTVWNNIPVQNETHKQLFSGA